MTNFYLYRLKIERSETLPLFGDKSRSSGEIILSAIKERPFEKLRKDQFWCIGNVEEFPPQKVLFALGKITKATQDLYDDLRGDFVQQPFEGAPHTYVAVDLEFQVCAIAHKPKIAPRVDNIASNLAKLLYLSSTAISEKLKFTLSNINDAEKFLSLIRNAFRIRYFEMTFSRPNPFDVDRQFHKPLQDFLEATHGEEGKTIVKGPQLEPGLIEETTHSVAATGNQAKARIQSQQSAKSRLISLSGNTARVVLVNIKSLGANKDLIGKLFVKICAKYIEVCGSEY